MAAHCRGRLPRALEGDRVEDRPVLGEERSGRCGWRSDSVRLSAIWSAMERMNSASRALCAAAVTAAWNSRSPSMP